MTAPHDLPGDPPPEDDAVDLAARLLALINEYPNDAQGRRQMEEVRRVIDTHMTAEDNLPEWNPVETWPNTGPGWQPTTWIIPHMLPAGRVTLFSGEGAAGKTRIIMQLMASLALGFPRPFLRKEMIPNSPHFTGALDQDDKPVPGWQGSKVVWGTWETAPGDFQGRLEAASSMTPISQLSGRLGFNNMRPHGALWGPEKARHISTAAELLDGGRRILDYAETFGAKILILVSRASTKHASGAEQKCISREIIGQRKCPGQLFGRSVTEAGWQRAGRVSEDGFWRDLWVV